HLPPLAQLGQPPAAGLVEHLTHCGVEGLLPAGGLDGALQVLGVAPPLNAAHRRSPSPVPSGTPRTTPQPRGSRRGTSGSTAPTCPRRSAGSQNATGRSRTAP